MQEFGGNDNIFGLLSEAVSEGILVVNHEQIIVATNSRTNEMFGYVDKELVGQPLEILIPKKYREKHKGHIHNYNKNKDKRRMAIGRTLYGVRKNQLQFPLEIGLNPFNLYGVSYVMALVIDVTDVKEKEKQILELNSQLEKKIKERTKELRDTVAMLKREIRLRTEAEAKMKQSLQKERELNELKTKFLSLVSHEFKTPLSGILSSATLVGKYVLETDQDKRNRHLKTIMESVRHLNGILDDFLSLERLEEGKGVYAKTDFHLSNVVNNAIYNANMILKKGQRISYPQNIDDVVICQDEKIVALTLTNLLNNAIKYSPEDSEIDVLIRLESRKIVFQIVDQGIGIPKNDQKYIFDRYFRAENAVLTLGTGIGLNIVKSHLENLGGALYFESVENKGSTFTAELPLS
ncbi:PAS domain-containing sensor histidine kinase [Arenibacter sp. GZD96]|uniref:PAS domain-containing sensor histidine kinase n=1 Tax=Aurantibrevibacter litoralis TaxID=3106030 RepID=UPI002AFF15D9|nr:PAS domain-containing sensor histidine kinase [Arenibacter sp. GZD-96]MEA1785184.1 PAS domain-containing sensor histidine kinase [Arenibacter sp. GZD-96]